MATRSLSEYWIFHGKLRQAYCRVWVTVASGGILWGGRSPFVVQYKFPFLRDLSVGRRKEDLNFIAGSFWPKVFYVSENLRIRLHQILTKRVFLCFRWGRCLLLARKERNDTARATTASTPWLHPTTLYINTQWCKYAPRFHPLSKIDILRDQK